MTSVLAWDPVEETWQEVGELEVAASYRAVVEVPMSIGGPFCSSALYDKSHAILRF